MTDEIRKLLRDIQQWMVGNDYECGTEGSKIYDRIEELLNKEEQQ